MSAAIDRLRALPRRRLALAPSPLAPAPALGRAVGIAELWIKHDELLGFGFGGNKVRGLELLVADALAAEADTLVTGAGAQSNHVRATAVAAAAAGMACEAVYWGEAPAAARGNLVLAQLAGARVRFTGDADRASVDRELERAAAELRGAGRRPYVIARGGAMPLGALAHALAVDELLAQCERERIRPALVVLAVGSGCTLAGWLVGRQLFAAPFALAGVPVSRGVAETHAQVARLAADAAGRLGVRPPDVAGAQLVDGFLGAGYGVASPEGTAAIATAVRTEGLFLDPTYTGKAFAGLAGLAARRALPPGPIVFVHTGGEPALFAREPGGVTS